VQTVATIVAKETSALFHSRVMVGMILLITGAGAGIATFLVTTRGQENNLTLRYAISAFSWKALNKAAKLKLVLLSYDVVDSLTKWQKKLLPSQRLPSKTWEESWRL
jgi:hypothetical protein